MRNLRIALGLRLLRRELREETYDSYKRFDHVEDHNARAGGYVQGRLSGIEAVRGLRVAASPAEVIQRFTRHWKPQAPASSSRSQSAQISA